MTPYIGFKNYAIFATSLFLDVDSSLIYTGEYNSSVDPSKEIPNDF